MKTYLPGPKPDPNPELGNFPDYWKEYDLKRLQDNPLALRLYEENLKLKARIAELEPKND